MKGWRSGELLTGVEALGDGGRVAEEAAAERAREARREGRPPQHHHVPGSSVPSSRSGRRGGAAGWRLAGEHGALHAASRIGRGPPSRLSPAPRSIALLAASISSAATATATVRRAVRFGWGRTDGRVETARVTTRSGYWALVSGTTRRVGVTLKPTRPLECLAATPSPGSKLSRKSQRKKFMLFIFLRTVEYYSSKLLWYVCLKYSKILYKKCIFSDN